MPDLLDHRRGRDVGEPERRPQELAVLAKKLTKARKVHRLRQQKSLAALTIECLEEFELNVRLDALGNDFKAEGACKIDDRPYNFVVIARRIDHRYERTIYLES